MSNSQTLTVDLARYFRSSAEQHVRCRRCCFPTSTVIILFASIYGFLFPVPYLLLPWLVKVFDLPFTVCYLLARSSSCSLAFLLLHLFHFQFFLNLSFLSSRHSFFSALLPSPVSTSSFLVCLCLLSSLFFSLLQTSLLHAFPSHLGFFFLLSSPLYLYLLISSSLLRFDHP